MDMAEPALGQPTTTLQAPSRKMLYSSHSAPVAPTTSDHVLSPARILPRGPPRPKSSAILTCCSTPRVGVALRTSFSAFRPGRTWSRGGGTEIPQCGGLLAAPRCAIVWAAAPTPTPLPMRRSLLFIPGPVAVSEPVLAAMAKPLINHRGPEYARLLHSIAERMQSIFATTGDVLLLGASGTGSLEA